MLLLVKPQNSKVSGKRSEGVCSFSLHRSLSKHAVPIQRVRGYRTRSRVCRPCHLRVSALVPRVLFCPRPFQQRTRREKGIQPGTRNPPLLFPSRSRRVAKTVPPQAKRHVIASTMASEGLPPHRTSRASPREKGRFGGRCLHDRGDLLRLRGTLAASKTQGNSRFGSRPGGKETRIWARLGRNPKRKRTPMHN